MPAKKVQGAHKNRAQSKRVSQQGSSVNTTQNTLVAQEILSIFRHTFSHAFTNNLTQTLQEVKGHLYNRDYLKAFGSEEYLQAYAVRWSPSRALAYRKIFLDTCEEVRKVWDVGRDNSSNSTQVVCIGGGAGAEIVAIAAAIKELTEQREKRAQGGTLVENDGKSMDHGQHEDDQQLVDISRLQVAAIDIASWTAIVSSLVSSLTQAPASQVPFVHQKFFSAAFHQGDILTTSTASLITKNTSLVTILFTTNELFTQSTPNTTTFLSSLGDRLSSGALLMIVESAGSYSMVKVGEKEYPMPWLLDLILIGARGSDGDGGNGVWKKIVSEDSEWYRLPKEGLKYPIELENMRYLVRVYQRV